MKKKIFTSERVVHIIAVVMTIFWFFMLFFPIYWLVITSFKDTADAFSEPPSFIPSTSDDYNIIVDYQPDVWEGMSEQEFQEEVNILLWSTFRDYQSERIGRINVICQVEGEMVGSGSLEKSSYTLNRSRVWDTSGSLLPEDIIFRLDAVNEYQAVKYNTIHKLPKEEKRQVTEITGGMQNLCEELSDYTRGSVTQVFSNDNWKNFMQNYKAAWEYPKSQGIEGGLLQAVKNSLFLGGSVVVLQWCVCGLAAYALSKLFTSRMARGIMLGFLATSMIPPTVTITATYIALQRVGLASNVFGVIIPMVCSAGNILLFKGNFDGIPNELVDAARIDGAGELRIFTRVVMPMSKSVFVTIGLLTFGAAWGEFFWSNIILRDRVQFTVPMVLKILYNTSGATTNYPMLMAMSLIISVPTILIMILGQKDLSKGMVYTGLKG